MNGGNCTYEGIRAMGKKNILDPEVVLASRAKRDLVAAINGAKAQRMKEVRMREGKQVRVGTATFIYQDGLLLLGKRKGSHAAGTYCLPGGAIELGEDPLDAAQREVEEETGMVVLGIGAYTRCPWVNTIFDNGGGQWITLFFKARCSGEPRTMEPDKNEGWRWYAHNEIPSPLMGHLEGVIGDR